MCIVGIKCVFDRITFLQDKTVDEAVGRFLKPMSREDFMRDIENADKEFAGGEYQEMGEALDEVYRELKI